MVMMVVMMLVVMMVMATVMAMVIKDVMVLAIWLIVEASPRRCITLQLLKSS